jgi:hypothetical protein
MSAQRLFALMCKATPKTRKLEDSSLDGQAPNITCLGSEMKERGRLCNVVAL